MNTLKSLVFVMVISALAWGCSQPVTPVTPDPTPEQPSVVVVVEEPIPAPAPAPAPAPEPTPPPAPAPTEWWQQRPFDPRWIVDTIATKWDVTSEPTDVEHLREKTTFATRKAYIDYLDVQYKARGGRSDN